MTKLDEDEREIYDWIRENHGVLEKSVFKEVLILKLLAYCKKKTKETGK